MTEKRAKNYDKPINISDTLVPEYDLWQLIIQLLQRNDLRIKVKWIKAHQDVNKDGSKFIGPLQREVQ